MLDFARKFQRSLVLVIGFHLLASFIIIFLFESLLPKVRLSLADRLELAVDMRALSDCLMDLQKSPPAPCRSPWPELLAQAERHQKAAGVEAPALEALAAIPLSSLSQSPETRTAAQHLLQETAQAFDRDWSKATRNFQTAVMSGAWTIAILSLLMLIILSRFHSMVQRRLILPIMDVLGTLGGWKEGNRLRRCQSLGSSDDLQRLTALVNELLDERLRTVRVPAEPETRSSSGPGSLE